MCEIKFRAWDDVAKRMSYSRMEQFDDMLIFRFDHHFETDKPIYMKYTGFKDRKRREIYEGDVLIEYDGCDPIYYIVEWSDEDGVFYFKDSVDWYAAADMRFGECEVIGNIYENPELKEGKETNV